MHSELLVNKSTIKLRKADSLKPATAVQHGRLKKRKTYKTIIESSGGKCKALVLWNEKLKKRIAMRPGTWYT